jgi:hypothetical protein
MQFIGNIVKKMLKIWSELYCRRMFVLSKRNK